VFTNPIHLYVKPAYRTSALAINFSARTSEETIRN